MSKELEALGKIDHTICMNFNDKNIKWNIDNKDDQTLYKNGEGYDPIDTDCKSFEEYCDCYDLIETALKDGEKYKTVYPLMKAKLDKVSDEKLKLQNVLEIIKDKKVNILDLYELDDDCNYIFTNYERYHELLVQWDFKKDDILTEKEFDLLKGILSNE